MLAAWLTTRPRAASWLVLLGVALASPSLFTGLVADNLLHQLLLRGISRALQGLSATTLNLFHFANGESGNRAKPDESRRLRGGPTAIWCWLSSGRSAR